MKATSYPCSQMRKSLKQYQGLTTFLGQSDDRALMSSKTHNAWFSDQACSRPDSIHHSSRSIEDEIQYKRPSDSAAYLKGLVWLMHMYLQGTIVRSVGSVTLNHSADTFRS
jgi:hypothetical protein